MAYKVAIIGSFRKKKQYKKVVELVNILKKNGVYVLSPKGTKVSGSIENFVLFESDEATYSPAEIQMITLEKILKADVVYVCDIDGYVGRTTSYEIGFCYSRRMPIYFFDFPKDLPIPVCQEQIKKVNEFTEMVLKNEETFYLNYNLCPPAQNAITNIWDEPLNFEKTEHITKKIVICGSMQFFNEMLQCQKILEKNGITAIIPKDETNFFEDYDEETFRVFKRKVSNAYLKKIREKDTTAILVYNGEKHGIKNYIGANTLVEIAMAFTWNRRIYLYNDIYAPLADELLAWECICLHSNIHQIVDEFKRVKNISQNEYQQLSLF